MTLRKMHPGGLAEYGQGLSPVSCNIMRMNNQTIDEQV